MGATVSHPDRQQQTQPCGSLVGSADDTRERRGEAAMCWDACRGGGCHVYGTAGQRRRRVTSVGSKSDGCYYTLSMLGDQVKESSLVAVEPGL